MKLTDTQIGLVERRLTGCHACGSKELTVGATVIAFPEYLAPGEQRIAGHQIAINAGTVAPALTVTCGRCFHIALYSPTALGLF